MEAKIRDLEHLMVMQYEQINTELLEAAFFKNAWQTIYVIKDKKLHGIITEGDYSRYSMNKQDELVRTKFIYFYENEKDKASELFVKKDNKIHSIPIVDKAKNLLYECCIENSFKLADDIIITNMDDNTVIEDKIKQLVNLIELCNIKNIIFAYSRTGTIFQQNSIQKYLKKKNSP